MRATICRNRGRVKQLWATLQGEVPGMPDEAYAGLEEPLLEAGDAA
jgi:hypothetical protein